MSNRASIQQETLIVHKTGKKYNNVNVFDDYGHDSIPLDDYFDTFYEDDMELLQFVLERIKEGDCFDAVASVIDHVAETQKGMYIEGTWYDWEEIKKVFDKVDFWDKKKSKKNVKR